MQNPKMNEEITLELRRTYPVPRERVFRAWTEAEQVKKWFGPKYCTCPEAELVEEHLGYHSLHLEVDASRRIVRSVRYTALGGSSLKTYTLLRDLERGDRFFPAAVRIQHHVEGFVSTIDYEYWLPESPPPPTLFVPSMDAASFIDRLQTHLNEVGLGDRIREDRALADAQLREFEEKLRRIQEGGTSGRR